MGEIRRKGIKDVPSTGRRTQLVCKATLCSNFAQGKFIDDTTHEHQIKLVKKEAMIVAGKVLSHPHLYRMAADSIETSLKVLPRFALYNHLNAWGRHRDIPQPAKETFHDWYKKHRSQPAVQEVSR